MPWIRPLSLAGVLAAAAAGAQQPARAAQFPMLDPRDTRPLPAVPLLSSAICGAGTFVLSLAGERVGQEAFRVECLPGARFTGQGRTQFSASGLTVDIFTTIEADRLGGRDRRRRGERPREQRSSSPWFSTTVRDD
jgi:hypothetical protein